MNHIVIHTAAQCLCDHPDSPVIHNVKLFYQFLSGKSGKIIGHQTVHMLLQGTDCLHQGSLKVITDTHNLSGCLHLCGQRTFCGNEFIERQSRNLDNAVVEHRLKACVGFSGDSVLDLVKRIAKCDLCCNFCNRITGRLGCKRGGTGHTRVYLDDAILKALRIECILHITSARDI